MSQFKYNKTLNNWAHPFITPITQNIKKSFFIIIILVILHLVKTFLTLSLVHILSGLLIIIMSIYCIKNFIQIKFYYILNIIAQFYLDYIMINRIMNLSFDYFEITELLIQFTLGCYSLKKLFPEIMKHADILKVILIVMYSYDIYINLTFSWQNNFVILLNKIIKFTTTLLMIELNLSSKKIVENIKDIIFGRIISMSLDFMKDREQVSNDIKNLLTDKKTWDEYFTELNKKHNTKEYFDGVFYEINSYLDFFEINIKKILVSKIIIYIYIFIISVNIIYYFYIEKSKILVIFFIDFIVKSYDNQLFMTQKINDLCYKIKKIRQGLENKRSISKNIYDCVIMVKSYHDFTLSGIKKISDKGIEYYESLSDFVSVNKKTLSILGVLSVLSGVTYYLLSNKKQKLK